MSSQPIKIGMLGGTFDPVHHGHLRSALEVREALGLDRLHMIPAPKPPLRGAPQVSAEQRLALLKAGIGDTPGLYADDREIRREGPSYSIDTLAQLRAEYGEQARLVMMIGFDAFLRLHQWHRAGDLFSLAHLVVMTRPGYQMPWTDELRELVGQREVESVVSLMQHPNGGLLTLSLPSMMAISATYIRQRLREGKSIHYLLPNAVEEAIRENGFYQHFSQHDE